MRQACRLCIPGVAVLLVKRVTWLFATLEWRTPTCLGGRWFDSLPLHPDVTACHGCKRE